VSGVRMNVCIHIYYINTHKCRYVVGFTIIYEKGYNKYYPLTGTTLLKVKGSAKLPGKGGVFDGNDLATPPLMPDTAFVGTCFLHTPNQKRDLCRANEIPCTNNTDCVASMDNIKATEFGTLTGECKSYPNSQGIPEGEYCEIESWCPLEPPQNATAREESTVTAAANWTIFARVNVEFDELGIQLNNIPSDATKPTMGLNLFTVNDIVEAAGSKFEDIAAEGCMIVVQFAYECDFNSDDECQPEITYERIDIDNPDSISRGFNYRFQTKSRMKDSAASSVVRRDLWKIRGVYIVFKVVGEGGVFDVTSTMITLGAGLSFLAIATVVCDFLMTQCISHKEKYAEAKKRTVEAMEGTDMNFDISNTLLRRKTKEQEYTLDLGQ
jgi:P2X purinoceptor 4